jgi:hypothetical protein
VRGLLGRLTHIPSSTEIPHRRHNRASGLTAAYTQLIAAPALATFLVQRVHVVHHNRLLARTQSA